MVDRAPIKAPVLVRLNSETGTVRACARVAHGRPARQPGEMVRLAVGPGAERVLPVAAACGVAAQVMERIGAGLFGMPHMITLDNHHHIWAVDVGLHTVRPPGPRSNRWTSRSRQSHARPSNVVHDRLSTGVPQSAPATCVLGGGGTHVLRTQVLKLDRRGKVLLTLGTAGEPGSGPDKFCQPTHVRESETRARAHATSLTALAARVCCTFLSCSALHPHDRLRRNACLIGALARMSSRAHVWARAQVAVARDGTVYVADGYCNRRVVKFNGNGTYLGAECGTAPHGLTAVCWPARGKACARLALMPDACSSSGLRRARRRGGDPRFQRRAAPRRAQRAAGRVRRTALRRRARDGAGERLAPAAGADGARGDLLPPATAFAERRA